MSPHTLSGKYVDRVAHFPSTSNKNTHHHLDISTPDTPSYKVPEDQTFSHRLLHSHPQPYDLPHRQHERSYQLERFVDPRRRDQTMLLSTTLSYVIGG